jgi:hypothetical protein
MVAWASVAYMRTVQHVAKRIDQDARTAVQAALGDFVSNELLSWDVSLVWISAARNVSTRAASSYLVSRLIFTIIESMESSEVPYFATLARAKSVLSRFQQIDVDNFWMLDKLMSISNELESAYETAIRLGTYTDLAKIAMVLGLLAQQAAQWEEAGWWFVDLVSAARERIKIQRKMLGMTRQVQRLLQASLSHKEKIIVRELNKDRAVKEILTQPDANSERLEFYISQYSPNIRKEARNDIRTILVRRCEEADIIAKSRQLAAFIEAATHPRPTFWQSMLLYFGRLGNRLLLRVRLPSLALKIVCALSKRMTFNG